MRSPGKEQNVCKHFVQRKFRLNQMHICKNRQFMFIHVCINQKSTFSGCFFFSGKTQQGAESGLKNYFWQVKQRCDLCTELFSDSKFSFTAENTWSLKKNCLVWKMHVCLTCIQVKYGPFMTQTKLDRGPLLRSAAECQYSLILLPWNIQEYRS